jgi:hypothetical protein
MYLDNIFDICYNLHVQQGLQQGVSANARLDAVQVTKKRNITQIYYNIIFFTNQIYYKVFLIGNKI